MDSWLKKHQPTIHPSNYQKKSAQMKSPVRFFDILKWLTFFEFPDQSLHARFSVAEEHTGVILKEERVLYPGETGPHRPFEDNHGAG